MDSIAVGTACMSLTTSSSSLSLFLWLRMTMVVERGGKKQVDGGGVVDGFLVHVGR